MGEIKNPLCLDPVASPIYCPVESGAQKNSSTRYCCDDPLNLGYTPRSPTRVSGGGELFVTVTRGGPVTDGPLGYKAHVHRTYVSDVERGARNPTVKVIWKLAVALETEPSVLFAVAEGL